MVTLALDAQALAGVRFTTSPLWEVGLSALVLRKAVPGPVHAPWTRAVRQRVEPAVLERVAALTAGEGYVVDLLTPSGVPPAGGGLDVGFPAELDQLQHLDPHIVHRDLAAVVAANQRRSGRGHDWVRGLVRAPHDHLLAELTETLSAYWAGALEPHWPRFARLATEDTDAHARAAARDGSGAMLDQLHPRIRFTGVALDIPGACEAAVEAADPSGGVLLVPSAFAWPDVHVQPNAPHRPAIAYGVRGVGTLWMADDQAGDHLVRLLGAGRARTMTALAVPATTAELSHDLSLAASTVNEHLHALTASRLATSTREGRNVVYRLTDLGRALLAG